jgi:phytoene dehydrogenase-like protein
VRGDIFMGSFASDQTMWSHFGYRTPIEGLYMAGARTHSGGPISGGAGYIASGIVFEDLGIEPWRKPFEIRRRLESSFEPVRV